MSGFFDQALQCNASDALRLALLMLGGIASIATVITFVRRHMPRPPSRAQKQLAEAVRNVANELVEAKEFKKAIRLYDASLLAHPNSAEIHYRRGLTHELCGDAEKARADWARAIKALPSHAGALAALNGKSSFDAVA